jgi:glycosyl transferase family 25
MSLPVFVVNLSEHQARRQMMQLQLEALGLDVVIRPAVDGRTMSAEEIARHYDEDKARKTDRVLTAGEIGCSLSHLGVYRHMLENDLAQALIFEDDAAISKFTLPVIRQVQTLLLTPRPTVVLLGRLMRFVRRGSRPLTDTHRLVSVRQVRGSHAYALNRAAASVLAEKLYPVFTVADNWGWMLEQKFPVDIWGVDPYCVGLSAFASKSSLASGRSELRMRSPRTLTDRMGALLRRINYRYVLKPLYGFAEHDLNW